MLHWHFNIYSPTVENNYFKIDSLVWQYIYLETVPRYDDKVYKMSHYLIHHFRKFKELNYYDFENLNYEWDLGSIPYNYKYLIEQNNKILDEEEIFKEKFSNFQLKNIVIITNIQKKEMKKRF